jgi:hypothetical protein
LIALTCCPLPAFGAERAIPVDTPMSPPVWALLERELIAANTTACQEFYGKYFDERGWLLCVERWGGDDGPDDAIENCNDWPILHALGAPDVVRDMYERAWEGHLRQYTEARTRDVPFARDGMYYKEFPVMFDWQHNAEGLGVFVQQGLSDPENRNLHARARRYAGFYMNEDPGAPNYDREHRVIRSLFNGSRGPLLRPATALDWTGDPIEVEHRFHLAHGERSYEEMLAHFEDYTDIIGDHPLNLLSTSLALAACMIDGEEKYRRWLLEYVDAWRDRMVANGNVIPSNIGLDGTIGGAADGKWYGGTYGWSFTVTVPQTGERAHRNRQHRSFTGFMNAYLLTGDDRYLDVWRKQHDVINAEAREIDGQIMTPRMYGDDGWYGWTPGPYTYNAQEIWFLSMSASDRNRAPDTPWRAFLEGRNDGFAERALRGDLERVRSCVEGMRNDSSTPDTRLADNPMQYNPCSVESLIQLMLGGIHVTRVASVLHCRLRYFDPVSRRPGVPEGVAALVSELSDEAATVTLVNLDQVHAKELVVQAGGYAEHQFLSAGVGEENVPINADQFAIRLAPGCGATIRLKMERYVNQPTMRFPWNR